MREAAAFIASQSSPDGFGLIALLNAAVAPLRWWRRHRTMVRLYDLDDHMLHDIGVSRADLDFAMSLPLEVDAVRQLSDRTRRDTSRRHEWRHI